VTLLYAARRAPTSSAMDLKHIIALAVFALIAVAWIWASFSDKPET